VRSMDIVALLEKEDFAKAAVKGRWWAWWGGSFSSEFQML
jgi:uncharacterized membrane protein YdcZ (DUF606 family)